MKTLKRLIWTSRLKTLEPVLDRNRDASHFRSATWKLSAIITLAVLFIGIAPAQERFGQFIGTVTDATGAVVPDVSVTASNKTNGRVYNTKTNGDGIYTLKDIDPGRYTLEFQRAGFGPVQIPEINLLVGQTLRFNTALEVSTTQQSIEVTQAATM